MLGTRQTSATKIQTLNNNTHSIEKSEHEAEEILRYIKDAYQIPKLISPREIIAEKNCLKKITNVGKPNNKNVEIKPSLQLNTVTLSRGDSKFTTTISNTDLAYKNKKNRRDHNLTCGFFSKQGQPYAPVGNVFTSNSNLVQSSLMTAVVDKLNYKQQVDGNAMHANQKQLIDNIIQNHREVQFSDLNKYEVINNRAKLQSRSQSRNQSRNNSRGQSRKNNNNNKSNNKNTTNRKDSLESLEEILTSSYRTDSGIKQIRQKLNYTGKMRADVNGGVDLLSSLEELQYKDALENGNQEQIESANDESGQNSRINSSNNQSSNSTPVNKRLSPRKKSKGQPEPWKVVKNRKQHIQEIAENQINQVEHERQFQEAKQKFSSQYLNGNNKTQNTMKPVKSPWTKVRTIGKIVHATKTYTDSDKSLPGEQTEDKGIANKKRYLLMISQLLSALYNMKKNSVKSAESLSEVEVKDLLNSEIELDEEGKPKPKVVKAWFFRLV